MRLAQGHKRVIMDNINILKHCEESGIDKLKLHKCNIEKMDNVFMFVLDKEDIPKNPPEYFGCDLRFQPDVVLEVHFDENGNLTFNQTDKTYRILYN